MAGIQHAISNQLAPVIEEGPRCIARVFNFTGANIILGDNLTMEIAEQQISFVQTIYFVTPVGMAVTLFLEQTEQTLLLPASSCGYIPILAGGGPHFRYTPSGAGQLLVHYINVPMPAIIWTHA